MSSLTQKQNVSNFEETVNVSFINLYLLKFTLIYLSIVTYIVFRGFLWSQTLQYNSSILVLKLLVQCCNMCFENQHFSIVIYIFFRVKKTSFLRIYLSISFSAPFNLELRSLIRKHLG